MDHLISVLACMGSLPEDLELNILQRLLSTLTHQNMVLEVDPVLERGSIVRRTSNQTGLMRAGVANRLVQFFTNLLHQKRHMLQNGAEKGAGARFKGFGKKSRWIEEEEETEEDSEVNGAEYSGSS